MATAPPTRRSTMHVDVRIRLVSDGETTTVSAALDPSPSLTGDVVTRELHVLCEQLVEQAQRLDSGAK